MNIVVQQAINLLASLLLGSDTFTRILGVVNRWADKKISGAEKRAGVLDEFEIIGLNITKSLANLGLELAVAYLKNEVKTDKSA
jgi:hypothetical protein